MVVHHKSSHFEVQVKESHQKRDDNKQIQAYLNDVDYFIAGDISNIKYERDDKHECDCDLQSF